MNTKKKLIKNEYIIWSNSENIMRIAKSKIWFIDGTFHHPPDFEQLLILMYKDYNIRKNSWNVYINE